MNKLELAEKIRTLRKSTGLRQDDLAAKAGVSIRVIRDLESGAANPTIESLELVCSVLGVSLPQILMPGMELLGSHIVDAPRPIEGHCPDNKDTKNRKTVANGVLGNGESENHRNKNSGSQSGQPPHEMPEEINEIFHAQVSEENKASFSENRASRILELQSKLMGLSDNDFDTVETMVNGLKELSQVGTKAKEK